MPNYSFQESSKPWYTQATVFYMYEDFVGEVLGGVHKVGSGLFKAELFVSGSNMVQRSSYFVSQDAAMTGLRAWATERFNIMQLEGNNAR